MLAFKLMEDGAGVRVSTVTVRRIKLAFEAKKVVFEPNLNPCIAAE